MGLSSVPPDAVPRKATADRLHGLLLFIAAAVAAFLLYRPDTDAPFEIIDFSETLPILTDGRDFGERFTGLVQYFLQHGRAAFGLSLSLAAKWTLFEWWTPGWQWTRYAVGLGVVVLSWHLLLALGANRVGATFGAALFIVSETVAPGWLRPSVNEPFGTLVLLGASLLACRYQATSHPTGLAVAIAGLLALMIMVKEPLVAATFFPLALAVCRRSGGVLAWPVRSRRNVQLLVFTVAAIVMASLPVLWALTQTASEGYARQFGSGTSLISNAIFGVLPAVVPFTPVSTPPVFLTTLAIFAWLVVLIGSFVFDRGDRNKAVSTRILIALAFAMPLLRMLIYLPWPIQYPYYAIPFQLGIAILVAIAVTGATTGNAGQRAITIGAAAFVLIYAGAGAFTSASRYFAVRRLTDSLVEQMTYAARAEDVERFVFGVPRLTLQDWWGLAPTLERYGNATGRPLPRGEDLVCDEARALVSTPRAVTILLASIRSQCPLDTVPNLRTARSAATRIGRPNILPQRDSLFADFVVLRRSLR